VLSEERWGALHSVDTALFVIHKINSPLADRQQHHSTLLFNESLLLQYMRVADFFDFLLVN
jgi:hypothetical protein